MGKNWNIKDTSKMSHPAWNKGKKNPELSKRQKENNVSKRPEVREKMKKAKIEYYKNGGHPPNYIDGSSRNRKYRLKEWIEIAKKIYERDHYTCQICNKKGELLNAHHIIPWAGNPNLIFDLNNLITLCVPCHSRIHFILNNPRKKKRFGELQGVKNENSNLI